MRARTRCFFPRFNHFEFCAPLVEASSGNAQLPRQFPYVLAGPQALDGHSLKFPGVSPSLHCDSFPGNCAHFCVSVRGRSEEHTSELQSRLHLVCRLLLEKKKRSHHPECASTPEPSSHSLL